MDAHQLTSSAKVLRTNFRAEPGRPRLLWDPRAHAAVGETCRFYLLSSRDGRGADLQEAVQESLRKIGVHGATCHIVYGPMDLLIRTWLSESKRLAFLRVIQQPELDLRLDQFVEFQAERVRYVNAGIRQAEVNFEIDEIKELVGAFQRAGGLVTPELETIVPAALEKQLLHKYVSPKGCKTYVFIYGAEGRFLLDEDERVIEVTLMEAGVSHVAIYSGRGFCAGIVKFICSDYSETLEVVQSLQAALEQRKLYCWSLVPPGRNSTSEGETLHLPEKPAAEAKRRLVVDIDDPKLPDSQKHALGMAIGAALEDTETLARVQELTKRADLEIAGPRGTQRFNSILCAILARDARSINKRLSFLISIESNLRSYLTKLTRTYPQLADGSAWPDVRDNVLGSRSTSQVFHQLVQGQIHSPQARLKDLDLPALLAYVQGLEENGIIDHSGSRGLLKECIENADLIQSLRDRYAHGVILDLALEESLCDEMWDILNDLITAIRIQISLEGLLSEPA